MEEKFYTVTKIEGDYATLTELSGNGEIFVALALLPAGTDLGMKIKSFMFQYEIVD